MIVEKISLVERLWIHRLYRFKKEMNLRRKGITCVEMEMEGEEWQKEMSSLSEKKTARVSGGWCGERSAFGDHHTLTDQSDRRTRKILEVKFFFKKRGIHVSIFCWTTRVGCCAHHSCQPYPAVTLVHAITVSLSPLFHDTSASKSFFFSRFFLTINTLNYTSLSNNCFNLFSFLSNKNTFNFN